MKLTVTDSSRALAKTPVLVVLCTEGDSPSLPKGVSIPATATADFNGRFREVRLADAKGGTVERVMLIGLGKKKAANAESVRRAAGVAVRSLESSRFGAATVHATKAALDAAGGAELLGTSLAEGLLMGSYRNVRFKSKSDGPKLKKVTLCGPGAPFKKGAQRGEALGRANCFTRDLQNAPGNLMTPTHLASEARKVATGSPRVTCRVMDETEMRKLKMGALLGVSAGSRQPAKLIHLVYKPTKKKRGMKKIALVGKGLTFDAGGISLKPSGKMDEMKFDMSGGAAVIGVFHALAAVGCDHEVHGVVPASENLPDGIATKPGDIHKAMNGTTIEVLNTDAEGRLILADALCYTCTKVKPDTIVDLATLTGAVIVALGHELTGMFPSTEDLSERLSEAGEAVGERVWPLPLLDVHREQMKSRLADLKNINSPGDGNGSTSGAAFLSNFVGDTEWCHLDIAGTAWGSRDRDYAGGPTGTGVGVRLLMEYLARR